MCGGCGLLSHRSRRHVRPKVSHRFACTAALKNLTLRWHRAFSEQKRQEKNGSHKRIPLIMILAAVAHDRLSRSFLCPIAQAGSWNIQLLADLRESNIREAVFFRNHNHRFRPNLFVEPFAIVSTGKHVCLSSGVNPSLFSLNPGLFSFLSCGAQVQPQAQQPLFIRLEMLP